VVSKRFRVSTISDRGVQNNFFLIQTRKKPKDLSTREREERGCGEGGGLYTVYMRERGGGGRKECGLRISILLSYTLRYVSLTDFDRLCPNS
jgi:hypothetical protein